VVGEVDQQISTLPGAIESAPYLAAFVASSLTASDSDVACLFETSSAVASSVGDWAAAFKPHPRRFEDTLVPPTTTNPYR
jgi:hypothetical protein